MWFLNANQSNRDEEGGKGGVERRTGQPIDVEQSDVSCAAFGMSSHR